MMDRDTELLRLEQFVEKLLLSFAELKEEKKQLLSKLEDRDGSIVDLKDNIKELESNIAELEGNISSKDNERTEISLRVGKLVEQIEDWELGLDDDVEDVVASDDIDEATVEEEGRVQHNLFSTSGTNE
jgi:predicted nuclease with TOPRIM domain